VLALVDAQQQCHGFGRIPPCLLRQGSGWRIGPLLADSPALSERLLRGLLQRHQGVVLLDGLGANPAAGSLRFWGVSTSPPTSGRMIGHLSSYGIKTFSFIKSSSEDFLREKNASSSLA